MLIWRNESITKFSNGNSLNIMYNSSPFVGQFVNINYKYKEIAKLIFY